VRSLDPAIFVCDILRNLHANRINDLIEDNSSHRNDGIATWSCNLISYVGPDSSGTKITRGRLMTGILPFNFSVIFVEKGYLQSTWYMASSVNTVMKIN
jgi:hypothetical protein